MLRGITQVETQSYVDGRVTLADVEWKRFAFNHLWDLGPSSVTFPPVAVAFPSNHHEDRRSLPADRVSIVVGGYPVVAEVAVRPLEIDRWAAPGSR